MTTYDSYDMLYMTMTYYDYSNTKQWHQVVHLSESIGVMLLGASTM